MGLGMRIGRLVFFGPVRSGSADILRPAIPFTTSWAKSLPKMSLVPLRTACAARTCALLCGIFYLHVCGRRGRRRSSESRARIFSGVNGSGSEFSGFVVLRLGAGAGVGDPDEVATTIRFHLSLYFW